VDKQGLVPQTAEEQLTVDKQGAVVPQTAVVTKAKKATKSKKATKAKADLQVSIEGMTHKKLLVAAVSNFYNGISGNNNLQNILENLMSKQDQRRDNIWDLMNTQIWDNFMTQARPKKRQHFGLNDLYDGLLNLPNIIYKDRDTIRSKIDYLVQVLNHHFITT
jgi:hypothetical protein